MEKYILDLYYDHYKETFALSKTAQERRNKSYVVLCILEAISFLMLISPEKVVKVINTEIFEYLKDSLIIGNTIIQSLLWIMITYVTIRYCQDTIYVERKYSYLSKLEKRISGILSEDLFGREGREYLDNYPAVLNIIDLFYKMFSPILFLLINALRLVVEWYQTERNTIALVCDTSMFTMVSLVLLAYFFRIHPEIKKWCLGCKIFEKMNQIVHDALKKV